jgi:transcriptional regulator with XRE-family HTH domain
VIEATALAVRAGRRRLGLSQRALAQRCGLSKSAIGRVERAVPGQLYDTVASALAGVGLRLAIIDPDDQIWSPAHYELDIDAEDARDAAGRRLPAHLRPIVMRPEPHWRYLRREARARAEGRYEIPRVDNTLTYQSARRTAWRTALGLDPGY